ncbi:Uncharacterised protein [Bordetella pertussis]|nr:Uncharacterised protein [Bordetella pertussis]
MVTTTSAPGTSDIMRRRAMARCCWRMRPFTWGSPSPSLCSCRTSSLVMRSFFRWFQICQGTSSSTTNSSEPTIRALHSATSDMALVSAALGATCIRPSMSSW